MTSWTQLGICLHDSRCNNTPWTQLGVCLHHNRCNNTPGHHEYSWMFVYTTAAIMTHHDIMNAAGVCLHDSRCNDTLWHHEHSWVFIYVTAGVMTHHDIMNTAGVCLHDSRCNYILVSCTFEVWYEDDKMRSEMRMLRGNENPTEGT